MGKPSDFADILNGVMWFQVFFATLFIALRLYTRQFVVRNFGWDDVLMLVNLVGSLQSLHVFAHKGSLRYPLRETADA